MVGKHAMKSFGIIAVTAFLGLSACGGTSIELPDGVSGGGVDGRENEDQTFGRILNNVRIGNGAGTVTYDSRLDAAAQGHADDMVDRGYFAHESPEGDDVHDRIVAEGYIPIAWGENLAGRMTTQEAALQEWENSPPHDAMMNATSLEEFGLGIAGTGSGTRWVLVMATESQATP